jgi:hypothetical protein
MNWCLISQETAFFIVTTLKPPKLISVRSVNLCTGSIYVRLVTSLPTMKSICIGAVSKLLPKGLSEYTSLREDYRRIVLLVCHHPAFNSLMSKQRPNALCCDDRGLSSTFQCDVTPCSPTHGYKRHPRRPQASQHTWPLFQSCSHRRTLHYRGFPEWKICCYCVHACTIRYITAC